MISVVIPCYYSQKTLRAVVEQARAAIAAYGEAYQFVLVNDGSTDGTFGVIESLCKEDDHITGVQLSRNFGQQAARLAALPHVRGDYAVFMDDDGQHPVEGIALMVDALKKGSDVCYTIFERKTHKVGKRLGSKFAGATVAWLSDIPKGVRTSSFCAMKAFLVRALENYNSPFPNWSVFLLQLTRNIANVSLPQNERMAGESGYTLRKMISAWSNYFSSFSVKPIRLFSAVGAILSAIGFIFGVVTVIRRLLFLVTVSGYASTIAVILFIGGANLLMLGLVGEYIGRIFMTVSGKPQYVVKQVLGASGPEETRHGQ